MLEGLSSLLDLGDLGTFQSMSSYIHLLCEQCPLCARNARNSKGSKTPNELTTWLMIMHIQEQEKEKTRWYVIKMRKSNTKGNCG